MIYISKFYSIYLYIYQLYPLKIWFIWENEITRSIYKKRLRENKLNKPNKKKDLSELIRVDYKKRLTTHEKEVASS